MVETTEGTSGFTQDKITDSRRREMVTDSFKCWGKVKRIKMEKLSLDWK